MAVKSSKPAKPIVIKLDVEDAVSLFPDTEEALNGHPNLENGATGQVEVGESDWDDEDIEDAVSNTNNNSSADTVTDITALPSHQTSNPTPVVGSINILAAWSKRLLRSHFPPDSCNRWQQPFRRGE